MATTFHRRSIAAIIAILFLGASTLGNPGVVQAGSAYSTTGGCSGWGITQITTPDEGFTKTDAAGTGGCANTYSAGYFYVNQTFTLKATGWKASSVSLTDWSSYVTAIYGYHNMCNSGQNCGSQWGSSAP